jgi:hypothetical protein
MEKYRDQPQSSGYASLPGPAVRDTFGEVFARETALDSISLSIHAGGGLMCSLNLIEVVTVKRS